MDINRAKKDPEIDDEILETVMLMDDPTIFKHKFEDLKSSAPTTTSFSCTSYYPKQFHALRRQHCGGDYDYVHSLSRCSVWKTTGGKAGSFSKTRDGKLLLKYVTRTELKMFLETAPAYFAYMSKSCFHDLPTLMIKILGVYQLSWQKSNKDYMPSKYVLVMPNLFLDRPNISHIFDLKGSVRNRYVKLKKKAGSQSVLLDQNFLEYTRGIPINLTESSRALLRMAVFNDTLFLAGLEVVDYSLLVGVDEERKELVVGIIDYIRQYTWDKRLETGVKSVGMIAGKSLPTVISPESYQLRFRMAMERYFTFSPRQSTEGSEAPTHLSKQPRSKPEKEVKMLIHTPGRYRSELALVV